MNDAQRLDWLQKEFTSHGCIHIDDQKNSIDNDFNTHAQTNKRLVSLFTVTTQHIDGHDLRDAIDRAIEGV